MSNRVEFDWDEGNIGHIDRHKVTPEEFEQVITERFRAVGITDAGWVLTVVFTIRSGMVRGITAFPASSQERNAFVERTE